jgi:membrane protease YdiL (CAAX protease family)
MLVGIAAGFLLIIIPLAFALATRQLGTGDISFGRFTILSVLLTFLTTTWEELWFRSLLLNHAARHLPAAIITIIMGALFTLIHLLNPEINLLKNGPVLFLAGVLLTALYFYYRTIWLPVGLHFGNNFFGNLIHSSLEDHNVYGSEGYIYVSILLLPAIYYMFRLQRKNILPNQY